MYCPVGWGCRIHWLLLCRGKRPPHKKNECPGYETKQSDGEVGPWGLGALGNTEHPLIAIAPRSLWLGVVAPIYGLNRTNGILMLNCIVWLNWIAWNRNVLTIKPYLHLNCELMLNRIIWNWTVFDIETVLTLNWIVIYNCLNKLNSLKKKCLWQLNCVLMLNWIV